MGHEKVLASGVAACMILGTLLLIGIACSSTSSPSASQVDDAEIAFRVKAKLAADPEVNPFEIAVDAEDGVVTLSGTVNRAKDGIDALIVACDTPGVVRVKDQITRPMNDLGAGEDEWLPEQGSVYVCGEQAESGSGNYPPPDDDSDDDAGGTDEG